MVQNVLQYGFGAIAVLCAIAAFLVRSRRTVLLWAAFAALATAFCARFDAFWGVAVFSLMVPWALFCTTPFVDAGWRLKTGFVLYLTLGSWLCIYPTYHHERYEKGKPKDEAPSAERAEREAKAARGEFGFRQYVLANVPFRLVRGLDLDGGLRLVYTVDVDEAIKDKRDRYFDDLRTKFAKLYEFHKGEGTPTTDQLSQINTKLKIEKSRENTGSIVITFNDPSDSAKVNKEFMLEFPELAVQRSADQRVATFRIRDEVESNIRNTAVNQARDTVHRRIDSYGLKEAQLTVRDEDLIIEVPGDDEKAFKEIRDIISQTARLEFKMLDEQVDFFAPIAQQRAADAPPGLHFELENTVLGARRYAIMDRAEGEDMKDVLKKLRDWTSTLQVPDDHEIGFEKLYDREDRGKEIGYRTFYLFSKAELTGDMVSEAAAMPDQSAESMGAWLVQLGFTPLGSDRFAEVTGTYTKRRFAIILDGVVESAPQIRQKITGGSAVITMGGGTLDQQMADAKKLELVLRSGALPAPITPSNEQRIGATLGEDAVRKGLQGATIGAAFVLLFMVIYYSRAGMIANIAVLFNLVLQVAILAMFNASMTLPGIAGLVLTIGIAIDANVLINERIRDELRHGKTPRAAVDVGYDKAFSAILDGHVTTLISGLILAQYGTGPIKGFAVTLIVGIAVSLFTGVVCTRLMFDWAVRGRRVQKLHLG